MVNSPLIRPYLLGGLGSFGGGTLDSHESSICLFDAHKVHGTNGIRKEDGLPGRTDTWLITMVSCCPLRIGLFP